MPSAPDPVVATLTVAFVAAACVFDVRTREIPNELSAVAALAGVAASLYLSGTSGVVQSVVGAVLALGVLVPAFVLGGIGGGDVKMMAAVGSLLGPNLVLGSLILGMIAGGAVALFRVARLGKISATFSRLSAMARGAVAEKSLAPLRADLDSSESITLPYSVPMTLGTLASIALAYAKA